MKPATHYMDVHPSEDDTPERGDILVFPRVAYRVLDARPTESRVPNRWTLRVISLGPMADPKRPPMPEPGGRHWNVTRYRRGERPIA